MKLVKEFSKLMQGEFEISLMGQLNYFLRLQIKQLKGGTFVCQAKYCHELVKRFRMVDSKSIDTPMPTNGNLDIDTPMPTNGNLDRDVNGKDANVKMYKGMIRSLQYLTASRPDIMFSVCMFARYQSAPKESHLKAVKRILR
ncbi:uncharacterized mitochondrial protein AtMg00810-like [Lathyrus oleraceus]|uniref:uncharacterized mitochondrial protein AtMg00810-like n=1 Tax=Pisum sativum TaxID=3888 RepID=UPI0021CE672D|nr:uncharacterized mitochondrial protein AtMg00810-like [Pisum sativum]